MKDNLALILGIELITASQGMDFRLPLRSSSLLERVRERIQESIPPLQEDRILANGLGSAFGMVISGTLLEVFERGILPDLEPL